MQRSDGSRVGGPNLCVYCGSNSGVRPSYRRLAEELGRTMASRGFGLVYGGGRVGLMGIVADAILDAGGRAHGIIPEHLVRMETAHTELTSIDIVTSMHERKARMEDLSVGFIALPGGLGTFDEVFEILTWNQIGLISKPVVFLDVSVDGEGFFDPLFDAFSHMIEEGFVRESARSMMRRTDSPDIAVEWATARAPDVGGALTTLDVTSKRSLR